MPRLLACFLLVLLPSFIHATQLLPYGIGYNLVVCSDSLLLRSERPMHWSEGVSVSSDSTWIITDGLIVVADVAIIPEDGEDSVWVKVAHNQWAMGWLHRKDLLSGTRPDNPVSTFMYYFSSSHSYWLAYVWGLALALLIFITVLVRKGRISPIPQPFHHDILSPYPTLLLLATMAVAMMGCYIRSSHPCLWETFYYFPTLNPFSQPSPMSWFLMGTWLIPLLFLATADDLRREQPALPCISYICLLIGLCAIVFELVSWFGFNLSGLLFCTIFAIAIILHYWFCCRATFICGQCRHRLRHKGPCPHCGALNE